MELRRVPTVAVGQESPVTAVGQESPNFSRTMPLSCEPQAHT